MSKISKKREHQNTPESLINDDGKANFGTFDKPFKRFDFPCFKCKTKLRKLINKYRLTEWEAVEVLVDKGIFLTVVYRFGIMDVQLTTFFEKETEKLYVWDNMDILLNRSHVAKNLFDGNTSIYETKKAKTKITNHYERNKAYCEGFSSSKKEGKIEFNFELTNTSKPSVVSVPIKKIYPVYTEKDLFVFNGSIKINGVEMASGDKGLAIIDDHRGFYPRKSGYDWLTSFSYKKINGVETPFGLNITDFLLNDNQYDYHENGYWLKDGFNVLPEASFEVTKTHKHVKDEFNDINLEYEIIATHKVSFNIFFFRIDYKLNFGKLNGYIKDKNNNVIEFKDDLSLSEYRYTIL
ncbi:DUF2804 family protein [Mycoplasmatota bacterium WC30]